MALLNPVRNWSMISCKTTLAMAALTLCTVPPLAAFQSERQTSEAAPPSPAMAKDVESGARAKMHSGSPMPPHNPGSAPAPFTATPPANSTQLPIPPVAGPENIPVPNPPRGAPSDAQAYTPPAQSSTPSAQTSTPSEGAESRVRRHGKGRVHVGKRDIPNSAPVPFAAPPAGSTLVPPPTVAGPGNVPVPQPPRVAPGAPQAFPPPEGVKDGVHGSKGRVHVGERNIPNSAPVPFAAPPAGSTLGPTPSVAGPENAPVPQPPPTPPPTTL